jgi:hypothetical protein
MLIKEEQLVFADGFHSQLKEFSTFRSLLTVAYSCSLSQVEARGKIIY